MNHALGEGLLEAVNEVLKGHRAELKLPEIELDAFLHDCSANKVVNLLEKTSTLAITDLIVHVICVIGMVDSDLNRMSCAFGIVVKRLPQEV